MCLHYAKVSDTFLLQTGKTEFFIFRKQKFLPIVQPAEVVVVVWRLPSSFRRDCSAQF